MTKNTHLPSLHNLLVIGLVSFSVWAANASQQSAEKITVVGKKPQYLNSLEGILPVTLVDTQGQIKTNSLAELLSAAPEVNFNGQGGLLQTISIRGLSRWRIQTLVEGIPIHSERRAGNAAEFIAPSLVGSAYVFSGAASTQLGSGALGGGIDLQLAATAEPTLNTTHALSQNYRSLQWLGGKEWDDNGVYWGASYRHANNGKDALDQTLLNGFEQSVGWIRHVSDTSEITDALLLVSKANNIGKANADLPEQRITNYPDNDHWLVKLNFDWMNAKVYAHSARLVTQIVRQDIRTNRLHNKALGWGMSLGEDFAFADWHFNWQLALDARSNVEAKEKEISAIEALVFDRTNLEGRQHAWSLTLDSVRYWDSWEFAGGVRLERMNQGGGVQTQQSINETSVSGFIGGKKRWSERWASGIYLSHGFRVPTLTERFFSGSTPRGSTFGDPSLEPEQAKNLHTDIEYRNQDFSLKVSAFHQSIDNYIERVAVSPSVLQYASLEGAKIDGANYSAQWAMSPAFNVRLTGQWLWGEDNNGEPINDVSPHQHDVRLAWQSDSQALWLNATYRQAHNTPGSAELQTDDVVYFRAGYEKTLSSSMTASILINNITDKAFPVSTDDLAANAQGRDIELNLTYVF